MSQGHRSDLAHRVIGAEVFEAALRAKSSGQSPGAVIAAAKQPLARDPVARALAKGASVEAALMEAKFDPVRELILAIKDESEYIRGLTGNEKAKILLELQQYRAPRLKATEIKQQEELNITVNIVRFGDAQLPEPREAIDIQAEKAAAPQ